MVQVQSSPQPKPLWLHPDLPLELRLWQQNLREIWEINFELDRKLSPAVSEESFEQRLGQLQDWFDEDPRAYLSSLEHAAWTEHFEKIAQSLKALELDHVFALLEIAGARCAERRWPSPAPVVSGSDLWNVLQHTPHFQSSIQCPFLLQRASLGTLVLRWRDTWFTDLCRSRLGIDGLRYPSFYLKGYVHQLNPEASFQFKHEDSGDFLYWSFSSLR